MNILVVCDTLIVSGGLLRFVRLSEYLRPIGHEVWFLPLGKAGGDPRWFPAERIIDWERANQRRWQMTMVPGAGFPAATVEALQAFQQDRFGTRIQHILNDQTRVDSFLYVNKKFRPDVVVLNNRHWPPGSLTRFIGKSFRVVEGAVDLEFFRPSGEGRTMNRQEIVVGAVAHKNLAAVLDAMSFLPEEFSLTLIGQPLVEDRERLQVFRESGRLCEKGLVDGPGLHRFYREVDIVVHAELYAGWANLVAEAMASGVPVVCSRHGTLAIAEHQETALVLDEVDGESIAGHVLRLVGDAALRRRLVGAARERVEHFGWQDYAVALLDACLDDGTDQYTYAPELGLYGKWPPAMRTAGLESLLASVKDKTVLDLACAEGMIALECLKHGAAKVHGFEIDRSRVSAARSVCEPFGVDRSLFRQADLSDWDTFLALHGEEMQAQYDIVLYLGIQHHLPYPQRLVVLAQAVARANGAVAIRMPEQVYRHDGVEEILNGAGYVLSVHVPDDENLGTGGGLRIFVRSEPGRSDDD